MKQRLRFQEVKSTLGGRFYITHYGTRLYLDEILRYESKTDNRVVGVVGLCSIASYVIYEDDSQFDPRFAVQIKTIN